MMKEELKKRNVPAPLPKEKALETLQREEYGFLPEAPEDLSFSAEENLIPRFCGGNAELHRVNVHCTVNGKPFSFPFSAVLPTDGKKHPFFVHINFRPDVPDRYMPTEELVDEGFAVLSFCYKDVRACSLKTGSAAPRTPASSRSGRGPRTACWTGPPPGRTPST